MFRVYRELRSDVLILHLSGAFVGGPPASTVFPAEIKNLVEARIKRVVVDMEKVSRFNSTGLGLLIRGISMVRDYGGDLRIARLNASAKGVMVMTKLDSILKTYQTLEGAVRNFEPVTRVA